MKRFLAAALMILGMAASAHATQYYVAQTAGTFSGGSACNGKTAIVIGSLPSLNPGDVVTLCGAITGSAGATFLTLGQFGSAGNPITILFDLNASLTAPYWNGTNGAILISSKSFITIDGGTNGVIQNSDNGNNGQGNDQQSFGIEVSHSLNVIIKNLALHNIYIQQQDHVYANCSLRIDSAGISFDDSSHVRVTNSVFDHVRIGIGSGNSTTVSTDFEFDNNVFTFVEVPTGAGSGSVALTNYRIHDNHFGTGAYIWDTPLNCYHHEAFHGFGSGAPYPDQIFLYNNLFDGIWSMNHSGSHITAAFFTEFVGPTVVYANNIIDFSAGDIANQPANGFIFCKGDGSVDANNHCEVYNETHISQSTFGTTYEAQLGASQQKFQNNVTVSADGPDAGGDLWAVKPNNNLYYVPSPSNGTFHIPAGATTFAGWQGYGADLAGHYGNTPADNPNTYAVTNYAPLPGSLVLGLGANLTSTTCVTYSFVCVGRDGAKPTVGPWTAGAIQGTGSMAPTVPTGILPPTLSAGTINVPYPSVQLIVTGGKSPFKFTATGLPAGMSTSTTGVISGTPTASGTSAPKVTVVDANGKTLTQGYTLLINPAAVPPPVSVLPEKGVCTVSTPYNIDVNGILTFGASTQTCIKQ